MGYKVNIEPDEDAFMLMVPSLNNAYTVGDTPEEALFNARDLLDTVLAVRMKEGQDLGKPVSAKVEGCVYPSPLIAIKAFLYVTMKENGVTKADLGRLLDTHYMQVDRLLDPRHKSHIDQLSAAFAVLGKKLVIGIE